MNQQDKIALIETAIKEAMGEMHKHFSVSFFEILVDDPGLLSTHFTIQPLPFKSEFGIFTGSELTIQIDIDDFNEVTIIVGEDTEMSVTNSHLLGLLYWNEVTKIEVYII